MSFDEKIWRKFELCLILVARLIIPAKYWNIFYPNNALVMVMVIYKHKKSKFLFISLFCTFTPSDNDTFSFTFGCGILRNTHHSVWHKKFWIIMSYKHFVAKFSPGKVYYIKPCAVFGFLLPKFPPIPLLSPKNSRWRQGKSRISAIFAHSFTLGAFKMVKMVRFWKFQNQSGL